MSTPAQIAPLQQVTFKKSDFDDESLTLFNQQLTNIVQALNNLGGFNGPIKFPTHVDLGGNRIMNVAPAESPTDAVSQEFGAAQYGPAALAPQLNALGKYIMQTYRQLGNPNQREPSSSFLNKILNTSPTTNTSLVLFGSAGSGYVPVIVTGGLHQFVDGTQEPYATYNDSIPLATSYTISTLTRSGGTVSGSTTTSNSLIAGESIAITGASDASFDGQFTLISAISPNFSYAQNAPDGSSSGGTISYGSVYYYLRHAGQDTLSRSQSYPTDSWSNRLASSIDGSTIIAVAIVNGTGGDPTNSAGGATPPSQNNNVRIFGRL